MAPINTQPANKTKLDASGRPIQTASRETKATQTTPRYDLLSKDASEPLAVDVEFQTYKYNEADPFRHRIGKIAFVNTRGEVIYDTFVKYVYEANLIARDNPGFGVTWADLNLKNGAKRYRDVEPELRAIMRGRKIIGHGMTHDIESIEQRLWALTTGTVDTQALYGQIRLERLVNQYLPDLDFTAHDPTHDARATMGLYLLRRPYKGRTSFADPITFDVKSKDDFPALG